MLNQIKQDRLAQFAWFVLAITLVVILGGGYVSASGSGDGCGDSWPRCGQPISLAEAEPATLIEWTHRLTSGMAFLLVVGLVVWVWRRYEAGHWLRRAAAISFLFMVLESLIGALIVLTRLVADSDAVARVVTQPLHLVNTFLLLAALMVTTWGLSGGGEIRLRSHPQVVRLLLISYIAILVVGTTGSFASLASHLFPAESFAAGVQQDFSPSAPFFVKLRIWHPIAAAITGLLLVVIANRVAALRPTPHTLKMRQVVLGLFFTEFGIGVFNAVLNAPLLMQMIHLLMADLFWLAMVWLGAAALAEVTAPAATDIAGEPIGYIPDPPGQPSAESGR